MNESKWRQLVKEAVEKDKTAFNMLYRETERSVYFLCLKLLGNEDSAKDVVQETYLTAYDRLSTLDDGANFPKWINGIAVNFCKRSFRKTEDISLEEKLEQGEQLIDEENFIPEDYVTDDEKRRVIMNIIDASLPDAQRQTIILYYYNGLSTKEIANLMDCPEGTVTYRLSSARAKIKEAVLIYEEKHGERLHGFVPVPILTQILRIEAERITPPDIPLFKKPAINKTSANKLKAGGKETMKTALKTKIIAAAAATAVAGGGIAAAVLLNNNKAETSPAKSVISSIAENESSAAESSAHIEDENGVTEDISMAEESSEAETTKPVIDDSEFGKWLDFRFYYPSDFFGYHGYMSHISRREVGENKSAEFMIRLYSQQYAEKYGKEDFDVYDVPDMIHEDLMHHIDDIDEYNAYELHSEIEVETVEERELLDTTFLRHTGIVHCRTSDIPEKEEGIVYFAAYYGKIDTYSYHGKNLPVCWFIVSDDENIRDDVENLADTIAEYAEWDENTKKYYSSLTS